MWLDKTFAMLLCLGMVPLSARAALPEQWTANPANEAGPIRAVARTDSDRQIATGVRQRLAADPAVDAYHVYLTVDRGNVTLTGEVLTLLAKHRAVALTKTIPGVRKVNDRLYVSPVETDPSLVLEAVRRTFRSSPALKSYEINPTLQDGYLALQGNVQSEEEKQLAGLLAEGVRGVRGVENELQIAYQPNRSDTDIMEDILSRMHWDVWLKDPQVRVSVLDAAVSLSGYVPDAFAKEKIRQDAYVAGAKSVDLSSVKIVPNPAEAMREPIAGLAPTGRLTDDEVTHAVEQKLSSLLPQGSAIPQVRVNNGVVTLNGRVGDLRTREMAGIIARVMPGVEAVQNSVQVTVGKGTAKNAESRPPENAARGH